jgi:hypothetical protein
MGGKNFKKNVHIQKDILLSKKIKSKSFFDDVKKFK